MDRFRIKISAAAAAIAAIAIVGAGLAQKIGPPPGPDFAFGGPHVFMHGPGGPPPFMMLLRSANLTADQQKHVSQIMEADRAAVRSNFEQLHRIHEQIADKLLAPGALSASDLEPLEKQAADLRDQVDNQQLRTALKIRALLTADQLKKVGETHDKLKGLFEQMHQLMGPPGGPA